MFAARFPPNHRQTFLETEDGRLYSYADMELQSARVARLLLERGMAKGERVAVQVDKSPQALFLYLGCLRAGCIYLPLNTAYTTQELRYFFDNARPRVAVCRPEAQKAIDTLACEFDVAHVFTLDAHGNGSLMQATANAHGDVAPAPCDADDVAAILYTSGTTGKSKGAMITHGNLAANGISLQRAWGFTAKDVLLHALPIFHIHGLFVACHCVLLSAARILFLRRFDAAQVARLLPRATVFMGVPTYYTRLLAEPGFNTEACRSMRLFTSGSAPLLEQTFEEFRARTGHTILERYGMTETGMNTSNPLTGERRAGTVGPPLPGVRVRVVDADDRELPAGEAGRLQVAGANVFKGYWQLPDKTAEAFTHDGYFRTGDIGRIDVNGYVAIVGRDKDMVISGGYNVYPKEIEQLIDSLDGVVESAVIGVAHPEFGEAVTAVVVRRAGAEQPDEANIIAALKDCLANYKIPKRVFFVDTLPRNTMGKVQKNVLRERYTAT